MNTNISNPDYEIAQVNEEEINVIKKAENLLKEETGKDYILIAWQKDKVLN